MSFSYNTTFPYHQEAGLLSDYPDAGIMGILEPKQNVAQSSFPQPPQVSYPPNPSTHQAPYHFTEHEQGRPAPPTELVPHLNQSHTPSCHGRVPDQRGCKDTTIAQDYYYSLKTPGSFTLPQSGKTIAYRGPELVASVRFKSREFIEYLRVCPRRPTLCIQIQPAQRNHRYIRGGASFKCRFESCPSRLGTILKGQARVALHEFEDEKGEWLNPFATAAGYVHLYCLEQAFNFIQLCQHPGIKVVSESRSLVHEPISRGNPRVNNPMALDEHELEVVEAWRREIGAQYAAFCQFYPDAKTRPRWEPAKTDRLVHRLTVAHLEGAEWETRNAQNRKRKAAASGTVTALLSEHCGDVSKQVAMQNAMRKRKHEVAEEVALGERPSKKRRTQHPLELENEVGDAAGRPALGFGGFQCPPNYDQAPIVEPMNNYFSDLFPIAQAPAPAPASAPLFSDPFDKNAFLLPINTQQLQDDQPTVVSALSLVSPKTVFKSSPEASIDGELDVASNEELIAESMAELGKPDAQCKESGDKMPIAASSSLSPTNNEESSDAALVEAKETVVDGDPATAENKDDDSLFGDFEE